MSAHFGFVLTATKARPFWAGVAGALAGTALSLGGALAQDLGGALAQDSGSMQVGEATVTVGAGAAILTLPDVPSFVTLTRTGTPFSILQSFKFSDDFGEEIGWNVNGSIEVPMGVNKSVSLSGFWVKIDGDSSTTCNSGTGEACNIYPLVDNSATAQQTAVLSQVVSNTDRQVDQWGASLESKWLLQPGVSGVTMAPAKRYWALGADIRGIDQDLKVNMTSSVPTIFADYSEDLDTTFYGAYAAFGSGYSPFLFKDLWERWGLQSSFRLQGGIYNAETDYKGTLTAVGATSDPSGTLSLSNNEIAFIGGLKLETRKQIGRRATLSLTSDYEYYSYVPEMLYNQVDGINGNGDAIGAGGQTGTTLGSGDAFSVRAMLRLSIKLGPESIM